MEVTLHVSVSEHVSNAYTVAIRAKNVNYWLVFVEICFRKGEGFTSVGTITTTIIL